MRASSVDRMLDFAARNNMALKNIPGYEEIIADIQGRTVVDAETEARVDEAFRERIAEAKEEQETAETRAEGPLPLAPTSRTKRKRKHKRLKVRRRSHSRIEYCPESTTRYDGLRHGPSHSDQRYE